MLKEVKILRKEIRSTWDGSLIKISEKGKPDKFQNTDAYLIGLVDKAVRAVREDCIASYHDYLDRPTKFNGISFEDALRKGMRWRKTATRRKEG